MSSAPSLDRAAVVTARAPSGSAALAAYTPRAPDKTILYAIVREHLETFLALASERYARPLPAYVVAAFRAYLACGILANGFLRVVCCGCRHEALVAFSCKARGLCPSCGARRMSNLAAHVVDRILPNVPVRQWVLSLPYDLRRLLASRPEVLRAVAQIFAESIARRQRAAAKIRGAQSGAITFPQRFGGSLNAHVHMHVVVLDGVYAGTADGAPTFHPTPPPTRAELELVARDVRDRVLRWLRKRGLLDPSDEDDTDEPNALDACTQLAIAPGTFVRLDPRGRRIAPDDDDEIDKRPKDAANADGFDVHAAVRIRADDDIGCEKLTRYCARPPFALDRISVLPDGKIAYRVKYARRGATHRVMTPTEFLARLAALIPPPKYPLVRYHGVLAPHAKWRRAIVPRPPHEADACGHDHRRADRGRAAATASTSEAIAARDAEPVVAPTTANVAPLVARAADPAGQLSLFAPPPIAVPRPPNILSDGHVRRLLGGQLLARAPRVPWATLMRRTFDLDVLACPRCSGRMRIVADIEDPAVAAKILAHLGKPTRAPPIARARDPGDDDDEPAPPSSDYAT
jgi:hypothetical protein